MGAVKPRAMKAMGAMKKNKHRALSASGAYSIVAEMVGLEPKQVKEIAEAMVAIAAEQMKEFGSFKFADAINIKLKKKPATPSRVWICPDTYEPFLIKGKPASQTLRAVPNKKFVLMVIYSGCRGEDLLEREIAQEVRFMGR